MRGEGLEESSEGKIPLACDCAELNLNNRIGQ